MRILLLISVPLFSLLFWFPLGTMIELDRTNKSATSDVFNTSKIVSFDIPVKESSFQPIQQILGLSIPDSNGYEVCFQNVDTKLIYENGEADKNATAILNFENTHEFNISHGETVCVDYPPNKKFSYNWAFIFPINVERIKEIANITLPIDESMCIQKIDDTRCMYKGGSVRSHFDVTSYAKPKVSFSLSNTIAVLIAWASLIWLTSRIMTYIKYGWDTTKVKNKIRKKGRGQD